MYPENPRETQVIVGSMNMGYISDTTRNRTHNLFRLKREPIPLGHSDFVLGLPQNFVFQETYKHACVDESWWYIIPCAQVWKTVRPWLLQGTKQKKDSGHPNKCNAATVERLLLEVWSVPESQFIHMDVFKEVPGISGTSDSTRWIPCCSDEDSIKRKYDVIQPDRNNCTSIRWHKWTGKLWKNSVTMKTFETIIAAYEYKHSLTCFDECFSAPDKLLMFNSYNRVLLNLQIDKTARSNYRCWSFLSQQ